MNNNALRRFQEEFGMARKKLNNLEESQKYLKTAQEDLEGVRQELAKYQQEEKRLSSIMEPINMEFLFKKENYIYLIRTNKHMGTCYIYRTENPLPFK